MSAAELRQAAETLREDFTLTIQQVDTIKRALAGVEWESMREAEQCEYNPDPTVPGFWRARAASAADAYAAMCNPRGGQR